MALLVGCSNQSFKGAWSYETKSNVLDSLTFVCARAFFPENVPRPLSVLPKPLDPSGVALIHGRLQELLDDIATRHVASYDRLCAVLQQELRREIQPRLVLSTTGRPVAHVEANGDVTLDLHVVQAVYRAMVMTNLPEEGWPNYLDEYDFSGFAPLDEEVEARYIAAFLEFKHEVEGEMGYCIIGDLFVDLFQSQWQENAERTALLEERLLGGLLFLLAHEVGHLVLEHFAGERAIDDETAFQDAEVRADRYAATLLGDAVGARWAFGRQYQVTRTMRGYELFFRAVYGLAGFEGAAPSGRFDHPDWRVRLEAAQAAYHAALEAAQQEAGR